MSVTEIPAGLCQCGCGRPTRTIEASNARRGLVRGAYRRFVAGHGIHARWQEHVAPYVVKDCGYETACWIWQRATRAGYASVQGASVHRLMWEQAHGPVPEGLELDHLCRQRLCVNPQHLESVTHAENVRRSTATRLTPDQVREIRASPLSNRKLAPLYGVSHVQIHKIKRRESWRDLP